MADAQAEKGIAYFHINNSATVNKINYRDAGKRKHSNLNFSKKGKATAAAST